MIALLCFLLTTENSDRWVQSACDSARTAAHPTREDSDRKGSLTVSSGLPYHIAADGLRIAAGAGGLIDDRTLAHDDDPIGELKDLVEVL
jgi:hypothetical protein